MNYCQEEYLVQSPSYFWSCLTLSEECPFFSIADPKLYYFGLGLLALYTAFLIIVVADLRFYWSLDNFQRQIDNYINLVRKKLRKVQMDQRRLMSTRERTEKQLKKSQEGMKMVTTLRAGMSADNSGYFSFVNEPEKDTGCGLWCDNSVYPI